MTLEQLRIFVAVAELEHVTRAAADLNLTQSATSAAVSALEARYSTKLFDRVGRRIALTDYGRIFLVEARAVLARAASAELVLADLAGLKVGSLRLAASQTVGNYWLPSLIHKFRSSYPGLSVKLTMGNTETVAAMVSKGEANLGFVEGEVEGHALNIIAVADDEMLLIVAPNHVWADHQRGVEFDLRPSPWVMREHGSGTRSILEAMLKARGHSLSDVKISLEFPSNEAVRVAVEAGAGATVMSRLVVANALKAGRLVAVAYPVPRRKFLMLRHNQHHETAAELEFVRLVLENGV